LQLYHLKPNLVLHKETARVHTHIYMHCLTDHFPDTSGQDVYSLKLVSTLVCSFHDISSTQSHKAWWV